MENKINEREKNIILELYSDLMDKLYLLEDKTSYKNIELGKIINKLQKISKQIRSL